MFKNRIRLPFYLSKPQFPVERNVFRKADGSSKLLSAVIRNTYEGKTDQLPEDWHRKLIVALTHDSVTVEDARLLTDVVIDGDYSIEWQDFLQYPVAQSTFTIQTTPFNASNSNCQTCDEISQISLVDDTTATVWAEGTTNEFPDLITANDTICCYPFTIIITTFNTLYFDSVTVAPNGTLTVVVKASVPNLSNVFVATYRVTCENGGYDEADVYGNISGTSTVCPPATGLLVALDPTNGTIATVIWVQPSPGLTYQWQLFLTSDLFTPVQTGTVISDDELNITGLTPGGSYTFVIYTDCGGGSLSTPVTTGFSTPVTGNAACGNFRVIFFYEGTIFTYTYFDCAADVVNVNVSVTSVEYRCMLMDPATQVPILFVTNGGNITYEYVDLC